MTVTQLMERLSDLGATVTPDGNQVAVRFPEEYRRDVEELGPEIERLKPQLMPLLQAMPSESLDDITLAFKVFSYFETEPICRSMTASELAETLHGQQ